MQLLPPYMIPDEFYKMEEFPLTVSGKIDRNKVIIEYLHTQNTEETVTGEEDVLDRIEQKIIEIMKNNIENRNICINKESDLASIGIDSVSFVKIIVDIECEFDAEFDVEELFDSQSKLKTVGEWIEFTKKIIGN